MSWEVHELTNYYQNDFESFEYKEHKEDNVIVENRENAKYDFHIKDVNDRILYSQGYLCPELKITQANGATIGEENVTLVNTGNLFARSELHIGNSLVEEIEYPSLIHHINGLINFSTNYSEMDNMFFYADTSNYPQKQYLSFIGTYPQELTNQATVGTFLEGLKPHAYYNHGFMQRWKRTKDSRVIKLWIPLKQLFGFFNDFDKLLSNIDVRFTFKRNESNDMLYTNVANPTYKVVISDMTLWLPHARLTPNLEAQYLQDISKDVEIHWCSARLVKGNSVDKNQTGSIIINTTSDELRNVFVVPQYIDRENNQSENNMIFDHLDMMRCYLRINNEKYPIEDYIADFSISNYARYYSDFLSAGNKNIGSENGCLVSYEKYGKLYPIIHFNVANHQSYTGVSNLKIEFNWSLRAATAKAYRFYFILIEKRKGVMNMENNTFDILKTLT